MTSVRTTVTLDPDVLEKIRNLMRMRGVSFKEAVNTSLRQGLSGELSRSAEPFCVMPHPGGGFRPGVDSAKLNQLLDDLEVDAFIATQAREK